LIFPKGVAGNITPYKAGPVASVNAGAESKNPVKPGLRRKSAGFSLRVFSGDQMPKVIAVDFDGTLAEHKFPNIGNEVPGAFAVLKELQAAGHRLILWTMRNDRESNEGPVLTQAVEWCRERGIEFWGVNTNPEQHSWSQSPKAYAHFYIDDAALGCPIRPSFEVDRPMVDWESVRAYLVTFGLLSRDVCPDCGKEWHGTRKCSVQD
jgi:hypothetical protein